MKYVFSFGGKRHEKEIDRAQALLAGVPGGIQRALMRSINRALSSGRTTVGREVAKRYYIDPRDVKKTVTVNRATKTRLDGQMISTGERNELRDYLHKPSDESTTGANRKPVRVFIKKGGAESSLGRAFKFNNHIFARNGRKITASRGCHKGKVVEQIEKPTGPSVPQMVGNQSVVAVVGEKMGAAFDKQLEKEISAVLKDK